MPKFDRIKAGGLISAQDYNLKSDYLEALVNLKVTGGGSFSVTRGGATLDLGHGPTLAGYWVRLQNKLEAAEHATIPSYADAQMTSGTQNVDSDSLAVRAETVIQITNRDQNFEAEAGDYILVVRTNNYNKTEWNPLNPFGATSVPDNDDPGPEFPPDTNGCICSGQGCVKGQTIPDALVCCTSHIVWVFTDPWLKEVRELKYVGEDVWETEEFEVLCDCEDGTDCPCNEDPEATCFNTYKWVLTPSITAMETLLELVVGVDGGCPKTCLKYFKVGPFQCICENALEWTGDWANIVHPTHTLDTLSCKVCLKPVPNDFTSQMGDWSQGLCTLEPDELPLIWQYTANFKGLSCPPFGGGGPGLANYAALHKYSGAVLFPDGLSQMGAPENIDVWGDINILQQFPLIRSAGVGTWHSPNIMPPGNPAGEGILNGHTIRHYQNAGFTEIDVISRASLSVECSGPDEDDFFTVLFELRIPRSGDLALPNTSNQTVAGTTYLYTKEYTDVVLEDLPCLINGEHTLEDTLGTANPQTWDERCLQTDPACDRCQEYLDPDPTEDFSRPETIIIRPFGLGPTECPNPPVDDSLEETPTDSGACDTCASSIVGPDPDDGSCCIDGQCIDNVTEALCTSFTGTFHVNAAACEEGCLKTACCYLGESAWVCADGWTLEECLTVEGSFSNSSCADIQCDGFGACCDGINCDGTANGQVDCEGEFFAGEDCETFACPVYGACCNGIVCTTTTSDECAGDWQGAETNCDPDPCAPPTGACCDSLTGTCSITEEADCAAPDYWWGADTTCASSPCDEVGSCCHNDPGPTDCNLGNDCVCELMTLAECNAIGGASTPTYGGDGTFCGSGDATCDCIDSSCEHA